MTKSQAILFLKQNQPLHNDEYLAKNPGILKIYDEVRQFFIKHPDEDALDLFLGSFGDYDGFGVYQLVEEVFYPFSNDIVVPLLLKHLRSNHTGILYWNAQIAAGFADVKLIEPLLFLLNKHDEDVVWASVFALSQIKDGRVDNLFRQKYTFLSDKDAIKEILDEYLGSDNWQRST